MRWYVQRTLSSKPCGLCRINFRVLGQIVKEAVRLVDNKEKVDIKKLKNKYSQVRVYSSSARQTSDRELVVAKPLEEDASIGGHLGRSP